MNKQKKLYFPVMLFLSFLTTHLYGADFWDYRDIKQFPIQSSIVNTSAQDWIKPAEMTTWGFGKSCVYSYANFSNIFSLKDPKFSFRRFQKSHVYELKRDFPFGKLNRSFGADITIFLSNAPSDNFLALLTMMLSPMQMNLNPIQFPDFRALDFTGNYKFKQHITTQAGDIIGTLIGKLGIVSFWGNTVDQKNHICYPEGIGVTGGLGFGIDYYPSQWFGIFMEGSIKGNRILYWLTPPLQENIEPYTGYKYQKDSYTYYPVAVTFGFKTTL